MVEQKKDPRKSLIWYCVIVLVVMAILNAILMPQLDRMSTREVDYGTFMSMTEDGQVGRVEIQEQENTTTPRTIRPRPKA